MKTMIKLVLAALLCAVDLTASSKTKDPYHLIVEGKFLVEKNVEYTVYRMDNKTGALEIESHTIGRKYFTVTCDVGFKYLIKFVDKHKVAKYLIMDVTRNGYFVVDVDFSKKNDAELKFTKTGYSVTPINSPDIKSDPVVSK